MSKPDRLKISGILYTQHSLFFYSALHCTSPLRSASVLPSSQLSFQLGNPLGHGSSAHPWIGKPWDTDCLVEAILFTSPIFFCGVRDGMQPCTCWDSPPPLPYPSSSHFFLYFFVFSLLIFTILKTIIWYFLLFLFPCVSFLYSFKTATLRSYCVHSQFTELTLSATTTNSYVQL